ncbi:CsbD family protein [Streptomyces sp. NBC_00691]|uniref:CsbD family protein n=1 Tax=Streptomyces sp. NBC_00691 TaxID=2903671 RepID=UPI002E37A4A3|nr:CsbD family protein [Streptomyces sp. NBC_00691]
MADKGRTDKVKGKAKETVGKVTGNDRMKTEGRMDQAKGKAKEAMSDAKDTLRGKRDEH